LAQIVIQAKSVFRMDIRERSALKALRSFHWFSVYRLAIASTMRTAQWD